MINESQCTTFQITVGCIRLFYFHTTVLTFTGSNCIILLNCILTGESIRSLCRRITRQVIRSKDHRISLLTFGSNSFRVFPGKSSGNLFSICRCFTSAQNRSGKRLSGFDGRSSQLRVVDCRSVRLLHCFIITTFRFCDNQYRKVVSCQAFIRHQPGIATFYCNRFAGKSRFFSSVQRCQDSFISYCRSIDRPFIHRKPCIGNTIGTLGMAIYIFTVRHMDIIGKAIGVSVCAGNSRFVKVANSR